MFKANGGNEGSHTGLNTAISTGGGTALKSSSSDYLCSTEFYGPTMAYRVSTSSSGSISWTTQLTTEKLLVRAVLAF